MEEDYIRLVDGIGVNLNGVLSVLLHIAFLACFGRQFSGFAAHDEAGTQPDCKRCAYHEATALYANDLCDAFVLVEFIEFVHHHPQALGVLKQCAYVLKLYARHRKVWHISEIFQ